MQRPRLHRNDALLLLLAVLVVVGAVYTVKQGSSVPQADGSTAAPAETPLPASPSAARPGSRPVPTPAAVAPVAATGPAYAVQDVVPVQHRVSVARPTAAAPAVRLPSPLQGGTVARVLTVLTAYDRPNGRPVLALGPRTDLSGPRVLLVAGSTAGWVQVRLPVRPNTATGWVRRSQVTLAAEPWSIGITRATHSLTVWRAGLVTARYPVAIGKASTPTPAGLFFVTDLIETNDPGGAYGPAALGLSGHSDVLTRFGSGDGVLGIHGTDEQSSIGRSVSHGCIRMVNADSLTLERTVPDGTPVVID